MKFRYVEDSGSVIGREYKQIIAKQRETQIRKHICWFQHAKELCE